jgi:sphingomyelin phosphodiesterase acid-like 3
MSDPRLVERLAAGEPADWPAILNASADKSLGRYGADTNWRLLQSALEYMKVVQTHPAFVMITGDFLAHHFREQFNSAVREHSDAAFRGFVDKAMRFLALEIEATFPDTPILPALGNNDEICGDFELQPNGPFLVDMLPVVRGLVGNRANPDLDGDWTSYGNYSATVPGASRVRLIFANTVLFSRRYRNASGAPGGDPGQATLTWLSAQLAVAERQHQHVWLAYHVPPGIDGFATWRLGSCPDKLIPMWDQRYAQRAYALLRRYAGTVTASFAGHTHMDDFRLIGDGGHYFGFVLITPALSPIFGQNPAFRSVAFDSAGGLLDQTTYGLTNLSDISADTPAKWQAEYTFTREWRLPRLDLPSLERLYTMITQAPADRAHWHDLFVVSSTFYWPHSSSAPEVIRAYDCATGHVRLDDFRQCDCGNGK